jgi:predicted MFS family arabinose efflux permease
VREDTGTGSELSRPRTSRTSPAPAEARGRPHVSPTVGFLFVTVAFTTLMAFVTVPTPLWPLYQVRDHCGATGATLAFATMVVGTAVTFPTVGGLSDRFGRRRIAVPALLLAVVASVVIAVLPSFPGLLTGRFLTGVAVGLMASTATAYLADLYRDAHPDRAGSPVPARVSTTAILGGLAAGPLAAGALAQWAPAPLVTPYVIFAVAMGLCAVLVLASPETVAAKRAADDRPVRFALIPGRLAAFGMASAVGFLAFALMGLFSSLGAIIVRSELGVTSHFVISLAPFTAFAASTVSQLALDRVSRPGLLTTGAVLFPVGLALTALSLYEPSLWLILVAAGVAGGGAGLLFKGAVSQSAAVAEPTSRAGVLAVFYVIAYLGMGLPSVAFSLLIQHTPLNTTMIGFGAVLSVGTVAAVIVTNRADRRP